MSVLDHSAIRKAYPSVVSIDDGQGAFNAEGASVALDQAKIDEARTQLNAEAAAVKYRDDRAKAFVSVEDQLDMQYWDEVNGTTTWKDHVAKVKADNPKPS